MTAWEKAREANRDYITPEDIEDAYRGGADPQALALELLETLGLKGRVEDWRLCAFVAAQALKGEL